MSELSQRLSQVRNMLDDLVEADKLVGSIGELLAQRNALREQLHELGTEIATKRPAGICTVTSSSARTSNSSRL